jgi:hypothetical protein
LCSRSTNIGFRSRNCRQKQSQPWSKVQQQRGARVAIFFRDFLFIDMTYAARVAYGQAGTGLAALPLCTERILSLRPTQFTVGLREVTEKRRKIEQRTICPATIHNSFPVVLGPAGKVYLLDRHHYATAFCRMGAKRVRIMVVDDLSHLDPAKFWATLEQRSWVRPFDRLGMRRPFDHMPTHVLALEDDPFRSLAGALRRLGLYTKTAIPYSDFAWADFLRRRIGSGCVDHDFDAAVDEAVRLVCASAEAKNLPGWSPLSSIPAGDRRGYSSAEQTRKCAVNLSQAVPN